MPAWLHGPMYLAIRSVHAMMLMAELGPNMAAASVVGRRFAQLWFNRKRLERAAANLAVAFPDWDRDQREHYAITAYEHLFMLAVETAYTQRLLTEDAWPEHVQIGDLDESVRHLLAGARVGDEHRPCVLITGHCGNWELLGYTLALLGFPVHALYRPIDLPPLDRWVRQTRQQHGLTLLDKFGATRELPRVLAAGGAAGFVADQNAGDRGLFVPFFGRLASAYKTVGLTAMQFGAPILCGMARRLKETAAAPDRYPGQTLRYELDVVDVIHPQDWAEMPDPLFYITARYRRAIETAVRRAPEQYLWMHRYWKSRPRHEHLGRPLPGALRDKLRTLPWMTDEELERIQEWSRRDAEALKAGGAAAK